MTDSIIPQPVLLASAPRCLAKTRAGGECQSPAVKGNRRCRMHGGKGSGAPKGNKNAVKPHNIGKTQEVRLLEIQCRSFLAKKMDIPYTAVPLDLVEAKAAQLLLRRITRNLARVPQGAAEGQQSSAVVE